MPSKVVIIAPFWKLTDHVGVFRVERFIRWFSSKNVRVVLICAGNKNQTEEKQWGREIMVKDPLGIYHPLGSKQRKSPLPYWLHWFVYVILYPDPSVVWTRRVSSHPSVLSEAKNADWILSSSPPESSHVASLGLAKRFNLKLIIDMRDGWLDEPLKPTLQKLFFQRWREKRLERRILRLANIIFVTSKVWKEKLIHRLTFCTDKTHVLTNAYPQNIPLKESISSKKEKIVLLHSGRLTGSSVHRRVSLLLNPFLSGLKDTSVKGKVEFIGNLKVDDLKEMGHFKEEIHSLGWEMATHPPVSREELFQRMNHVDGFLLLSASEGAVPSKLYEYLAFRKPILAATPQNSAVWNMGEQLPQVFLIDYAKPEQNKTVVHKFISTCYAHPQNFVTPSEFSEEHLKNNFLQTLNIP